MCLTPSCPLGHRLNGTILVRPPLTMPAKNVHYPPPFSTILSIYFVPAVVYVAELEFTHYNSGAKMIT